MTFGEQQALLNPVSLPFLNRSIEPIVSSSQAGHHCVGLVAPPNMHGNSATAAVHRSPSISICAGPENLILTRAMCQIAKRPTQRQ